MVRFERDVCPGLLDLSHNIVFSEMTWVLEYMRERDGSELLWRECGKVCDIWAEPGMSEHPHGREDGGSGCAASGGLQSLGLHVQGSAPGLRCRYRCQGCGIMFGSEMSLTNYAVK